jgi:hypothetical protein
MLLRRIKNSNTLTWGHLRKQLFGLSDAEASFPRRGFHEGESQARQRLEHIGVTFLTGYHAALEEDEISDLVSRLNNVDLEVSGFAFEGAAMGLALLDLITPWKKCRWRSFLTTCAAPHQYMVHVGVGWALARVRPWIKRYPSLSDPLLSWLAIDGYGFHEGYFHWPCYVRDKALPGKLSGYSLRVFDQGLGRSIWFVNGADVERVPQTVNSFPTERRADLWSGVGLACAYAGGANSTGIQFLRIASAPYESCMAQGAAFAAKARQKAGNPAVHTEAACKVLCGTSAEEAACITDEALQNLPNDIGIPAYEIWRRRIQAQFAGLNV